MENITLIGMAACGKSTIGVLLAKSLNLQFIDTDLLLQRKHNKPLMHIMESEGTSGFLLKESEIIRSLDVKDTCIATGGSAVYSKDAMMHLKTISAVVFIDVSFEIIRSRIADIKSRAVVIEHGKTLKDIYDQRLPLYKAYADMVINADSKSAEQIIGEIAERLIS